MKFCKRCGVELPLSSRSPRCPPCRVEHEKEYMKNYMKNRYSVDSEFRERMKKASRDYQLKKRMEKYYKSSCEACGKRILTLHHITDEAYGNETEENTAVLCKQCHIVANLLKRYFGDIKKIKLLEIIKSLNENKPIKNIKEKATKLL